ncbi:MAG: Flp pilus assembly protein CpaB [Rhodospirillales bacterium]|nr:Flp pilus assembly protein CpaB [Alphaproteobacteria bacterium]MCB9986182.1 Flp pilus assembly protein CpaB [Rhodospirillales bacterium]USO07261.1 MAG: Flp pilus assembly protein CpaB [Rhodospirillales bacterium]
MNRSTVIIVASGFFFALLAALAVQMIGGKSRKADTTAETQTEYVLVAARDLKTGEELDKNATIWAPWPKTSIFNGAIVREGKTTADEALKGRVARNFAKGEPMIKSAMVDAGKSNFVAASLKPGYRAVAISVNAQSSVAGFVTPGDHVDVILTYEVHLPADQKIREAATPVVSKLATETVIEDLRVLATDQSSSAKSEIKAPKTVTVEVSPTQAEQLILAAKMGTLSLVLRPIGDDQPVRAGLEHQPPTTTDIRVSGVMREIMHGQNKTGSTTQVVRLYTGNRVENVELRPLGQ